MASGIRHAALRLALAAASMMLPTPLLGQAGPAATAAPTPSKAEIFAGYANLRPFNSDIYNENYDPLNAGAAVSVTGYFNSTVGLTGEYARFFNDPDYCMSTVEGGPTLRRQFGSVVPFAHVMGGAAQIGPSYAHSGSTNPCKWGWAAMVGGGLDYVLPAASLRGHWAIRLIEADFHYSSVDYGPQKTPNSKTGGVGNITAVRLSAGFVYRFGATADAEPARFACVAQPVSAFPGDPINVEAHVMQLADAKRQPVYTWDASGGRVTPTDGGARVDTAAMAPGDYTVAGHVTEGRGSTRHADCTASFRVMALLPPTVACSANPPSIVPGGFTTITANAQSPAGRPLNYSYGATAGQITGTGPTATLAAADVNPGQVKVTCNVVDDKGQSASTTVTVAVNTPPPPPVAPGPSAQKLCSASFERDRKRPVRVDNEAKGCLDDIALQLTRDPSATLVIVGKHDASEKPDAAAERTLNVKQYMTDEKRIDPSRIQVRTGENTGRMVDNVLVPQGATWDPSGTTEFDPAQVKRHGDPYSRHGH